MAQGSSNPESRFVWPPARPTGVVRATPNPPYETAPSRSIWRKNWRAIEDAWFDPVALPLRDRIEILSWTPNPPSAYCDQCGSDIGDGEATEFGCAACRERQLPWARLVRLGAYNKPLDLWIREIKFQRSFRLARDLGRLLGAQLAPVIDSLSEHRSVVVVPAAISWRRRVVRGIDHASEIAAGVARELDAPVRGVLRQAHGPSQRAVPASARSANIAGRISLKKPRAVAGKLVVLIDDVTTSGATLRASARALQGFQGSRRVHEGQGPAGILVGVIAVTPDPDRRVKPDNPSYPSAETSPIKE